MHICHGQHLFSDTALFPGLCRSTYTPTPWVIAGSAITAQDDSLWSGFNTTPNKPLLRSVFDVGRSALFSSPSFRSGICGR